MALYEEAFTTIKSIIVEVVWGLFLAKTEIVMVPTS